MKLLIVGIFISFVSTFSFADTKSDSVVCVSKQDIQSNTLTFQPDQSWFGKFYVRPPIQGDNLIINEVRGRESALTASAQYAVTSAEYNKNGGSAVLTKLTDGHGNYLLPELVHVKFSGVESEPNITLEFEGTKNIFSFEPSNCINLQENLGE